MYRASRATPQSACVRFYVKRSYTAAGVSHTLRWHAGVQDLHMRPDTRHDGLPAELSAVSGQECQAAAAQPKPNLLPGAAL